MKKIALLITITAMLIVTAACFSGCGTNTEQYVEYLNGKSFSCIGFTTEEYTFEKGGVVERYFINGMGEDFVDEEYYEIDVKDGKVVVTIKEVKDKERDTDREFELDMENNKMYRILKGERSDFVFELVK